MYVYVYTIKLFKNIQYKIWIEKNKKLKILLKVL